MVRGYAEEVQTARTAQAAEAVWSFVAARNGASVILPDGRCDVIVRYRKGTAGSVVPVVTGPATDPYEITFDAGESWVGVRLRPERGAALWGGGISSARERVLVGEEAVAKVPELAECLSVEVEERPLRSVLSGIAQAFGETPVDARVAQALSQIHKSGGQVRVEALAEEAGVTARHLGRLFLGSVGLSAKAYVGVVRFHRALWLVMREGLALSAAAAEAGYADQAHLTRAVRRFAGVAPGKLPDDLILPEVAGVGLFGEAE